MLIGRKTPGLYQEEPWMYIPGNPIEAYDKLKKSLLTRKNFTEDGYRKRFREVKPETEEMPDQFVQPERIGHLLTDSLRQIFLLK